jgi:hypothetical protein
MIFYFTSKLEAQAYHRQMVEMYKGSDWRITLTAPLFQGDRYTVTVGM